MLPYFLVLPLWLVVAVALPLAQSLHALQTQSDDRKTWLFYWISFALASSLLCYFEWIIQVPFFVLAFYIDLYYEAQLCLVFWLVMPRIHGIKMVQSHLESNATTFGKMGMDIVRAQALKLREMLMDASRKAK
mmetsp:Transcript_75314/g.211193  ORF Transcript_75314/g.211193 Transcript_75314/m.211193 type:complete len:133 (+) Transcript_75314:113-511(+)